MNNATEKQNNYKLVVAYEGTAYAGFQRQSGNILTIQGQLESAICQVIGEPVAVNGAGRTDAGVHAQGQVVNFRTNRKLDSEKLMAALNGVLPKDIVVRSSAEVDWDFHARFRAISKTYNYRIYNHPVRPVFNRNLVYHYRNPLNVELMRVALSILEGSHDFRSFQASGSKVNHTVRTVNFQRLTIVGPELNVLINANGFLYHMVRNIVGSLIQVGSGRMSLGHFEDALNQFDRNMTRYIAPSAGLCLEEVFYED